jgi:hypothetical protein
MRMLVARRERLVARIWFLKQLYERLNLLGKRLNLLLEFLDLRFVTGDEGLDKVSARSASGGCSRRCVRIVNQAFG